MKKIIHVNQHNIKFNAKHGNIKPVFTVKEGKKNRYAKEIVIKGPSRLVYTPDKPLSCGARAYIITESDVECIEEMEYKEVCALDGQV